MKLFNRPTTRTVDMTTADIELLVFECAEVRASETMRETVADCCEIVGFPMQVIDVWLDPDAVVRHRLLAAPAVIVLADGFEIDRLVGPRSCRQVERFVAKTIGGRAPAALVAA